MKATCYHIRKDSDNRIKVCGGSVGISNPMDLNEAAEWIAQTHEVGVSPSGRVMFKRNGEFVQAYLSIDAADTQKGRAALKAYREQQDELRRKSKEDQEILDAAISNVDQDKLREFLRSQGEDV